VLCHALEATEQIDGRTYDIVVMLQPTSPLRTPEQVSRTIRTLVEGGWDSVWTVSETDTKSHPLKQLTVGGDGALEYYDPRGAQIIARQQLVPVYHRNGIAYAITRDCLTSQGSIKGKRSGSVVVSGDHVSIDTEADIEQVERILALEAGAPR
jgi:CMP-N,N'-diacetyllegionaminic acid synthase